MRPPLGNTRFAPKLPKQRLRFSKGMVALSLAMVAGGVALILRPWASFPMAGVILAASGLGVFFAAGYYWTCDNVSCS